MNPSAKECFALCRRCGKDFFTEMIPYLFDDLFCYFCPLVSDVNTFFIMFVFV